MGRILITFRNSSEARCSCLLAQSIVMVGIKLTGFPTAPLRVFFFFFGYWWCLAVKPSLNQDPSCRRSWLFPCPVCVPGVSAKACRDKWKVTVGCPSGGIFFLLGLVEPLLINFQRMLQGYYTRPCWRGNIWLFFFSVLGVFFWILFIWYLWIYI